MKLGVSFDNVASASATISGTTATWGTTQQVTAPGGLPSSPALAASADGSALTAAWVDYDQSNYRVRSASATIGTAGEQSWGPSRTSVRRGAMARRR